MSLRVREMRLDEVGLRIDYFHEASEEYLTMLGVDRARLPSRHEWAAWYRQDHARPLEQRENYALVWELDGAVVGFSSADQIVFGDQAFMHLHVLDAQRRAAGLGTRFVRLSVDAYFAALRLSRLYAQPNAFNVAPNRTLQRAGFRYERTTTIRPSEINFVQPVTRWVIEADR